MFAHTIVCNYIQIYAVQKMVKIDVYGWNLNCVKAHACGNANETIVDLINCDALVSTDI